MVLCFVLPENAPLELCRYRYGGNAIVPCYPLREKGFKDGTGRDMRYP